MKIPFDVKYRPQIESGEYKVEIGKYRHYPARIVCWDFNGEDIIVIGKHEGGKEIGHIYTTDGKLRATCQHEDKDLFIITPGEELTEWEKAIGLALTDAQLIPSDKDGIANIHDIDEFIKQKAAELLDLARVALVDEQTKREDLSFSRGLRQGREEAKKSHWIPASNPPDDDRTVFTCDSFNGIPLCVGLGYYKHETWWDVKDFPVSTDYWMEIPELPKE